MHVHVQEKKVVKLGWQESVGDAPRVAVSLGEKSKLHATL